ncbi:hypothetical protein EPUS_01120 [Endocarpon pusillum Z07020]|uniref:Uncharacterized protein n=1 Tax=Endocarpon pusillum (strain Z07020 / HMAS-L-300199) TaxID=1263415 RepID=U1GAY5_ENDPU|nr:uncharacterized protein EPUS_01120 [Endocarpon pusillum Z07020]ERF69163.1 hypothetical protein EPUS_01120 [Endocarpon pusillum Z07020]
MSSDLIRLCPGRVSDGEPSHNGLRAASLHESHKEMFRSEGQQALRENTSVRPSSTDRIDQKDCAKPALSSQHSRTEKASCPKSEENRTPSASPRKRRRPKVPTGPTAPIPRRRSSVPVRRNGPDLISFHRRSCQLFQSLEGTLALTHEWNVTDQPCPRYSFTPDTRHTSPCIIKTENGFAYLASTTSTPRFGSARSSRRNSSAIVTPLPSLYDRSGPNATATTSSSSSTLADTSSSTLEEKLIASLESLPPRPHPVSIISWTSTESRRREYEEIHQSYSGVRGLWKKITPRWCRGKCERKGFFHEKKDGEVDSVRRYRMNLDDEEDDDNEKNARIDDGADDDRGRKKEKRDKKRDSRWTWLSLLR